MSGNVGAVVAQLLKARDQLAAAAVTANRAKADADQAAARYAEAGQGSYPSKLKSAIVDVEIAGAKSDKVARLINEICDHIAAYVNLMAPGAAPTDDNTREALPAGGQLVRDAAGRSNAFGRGARRVANNAESAGDAGKKILDFIQDARPKGSTSISSPSTSPTPEPQHGTYGDAAQSLIVGGAIVLAAGFKALDARRKRKEKGRDDD